MFYLYYSESFRIIEYNDLSLNSSLIYPLPTLREGALETYQTVEASSLVFKIINKWRTCS